MSKRIKNYKTEKEIQKLQDLAHDYQIQCKCGTKTVIYPYEKRDKKICRNCGHYVYANEKTKFEDTLKKYMKHQEDK